MPSDAPRPAGAESAASTSNERPGPGLPSVRHRTFCRFCIALCGLVVTTEGDRVVKVIGDSEHPLSRGYTCPKGRAVGVLHHRPDRLDRPQVRRGGRLVEVGWDECLDDLAGRLGTIIRESGPNAVAMYLATASTFDANGRRASEKFLHAIGSRSRYTSTTVDTACKPLVSELMSGHPALIPAIDHERATLTLLFGSNPMVSHGHMNAMPMPGHRLRTLAERGELWVVDPRRTETARLATRHLPIRPGTDYAVLAYLVKELLLDGADHAYLAEHATGVDELARAVEPFDLPRAAALAGVPAGDLSDLLASVRRHGRVAGQTGTGTTMSAAANVTEWLMWTLHIVTASYDRPGGMWFNPGFVRCFDDRHWIPRDGTPSPGPRSRPELPGRWGELPCAALADEIESGNVRALLVVGGNPITSLPDTARMLAAFDRLEALAVWDVVPTDTTVLATHVLPCTGQLERADIPFFVDQFQMAVSSQYTAPVVAPGAERKPMWWSFAQLSRRLGHSVLPDGIDPDRCTDDNLLAIIADRSKSTFEDLRAAPTGVVWRDAVFGWVEERVLPDGRWRIAPRPLVDQLAGLREPPPLVLTPRRQLRHLNSQLRQGSGPAGEQRDLPDVLLHPEDAAQAGVGDGSPVVVSSQAGSLSGIARIDPEIRRGAVSVPHGFAEPNVSRLTSGRHGVDPLTGMVLQSGVPVTIAPR